MLLFPTGMGSCTQFKNGLAAKDKMFNKKPKEKKKGYSLFMEYFQAILLAVVLALFVRLFIVQPFHIPSGSMIPTFLEGDRVLVSKFAYGIRNPLNNKVWIGTGKPERGDVVIFIAPREPEKDFVKRVIGLPGETVALKNGLLYIDGLPMLDPHARYDQNASQAQQNYGPFTVPENSYFMMGDNRNNSSDSREWGAVDFSLLKGKAWRLYWSWDSHDPQKSFFQRLRTERLGTLIDSSM